MKLIGNRGRNSRLSSVGFAERHWSASKVTFHHHRIRERFLFVQRLNTSWRAHLDRNNEHESLHPIGVQR
jgi:hypothetical protein